MRTGESIAEIHRESGGLVVRGRCNVKTEGGRTEGSLTYNGRPADLPPGFYTLVLDDETRDRIYVIGVPASSSGTLGETATAWFRPAGNDETLG